MTGGGEGILYVVATPIGNLEDVSPRALRVLGEADWIAAEDTRHTRKLLSRYGIRPKQIFSCFVANESRRARSLGQRLGEGEIGALVTDAGTPGIADPGAKIVRAALDAGISVIPVPGPSAVTAALSVSGFPADRFSFLGFLPTGRRERASTLQEIVDSTEAVVFYESPRRVVRTLGELATRAPQRSCAVFRELTKLHEESVRGTLSEVAEDLQAVTPRGEFVVVIGPSPASRRAVDETAVSQAMRRSLREGTSLSRAAGEVSRTLGIPRRRAYRAGLALRKAGGGP